MVRKKRHFFAKAVRVFSGAVLAFISVITLSGCANEANNPFGTESLNGAPPKEEAFCVQMDCKGIFNGKYLPNSKDVGQLYPLRFTGDWKQIQSNRLDDWYIATTNQAGARIDVCAVMTRCLFDFWDYEMYDNPGSIELQLDGRSLGVYNLARKDANGNKILEYVIATQKNTYATASIILRSGRMTLSGCQINCFNVHWPYGENGPVDADYWQGTR